MVQQLMLNDTNSGEQKLWEEGDDENGTRPRILQSRYEPTVTRIQYLKADKKVEDGSSVESRDIVQDSALPKFSFNHNSQLHGLIIPGNRQPWSSFQQSLVFSQVDSAFTERSGLMSSATSGSLLNLEAHLDLQTADDRRRPSLLRRLRSPISTSASTPRRSGQLLIHPTDFQTQPELPENHFIDSAGMVIPGVCSRNQCAHPLAHFVTTWRLCEPVEYTTALADHGITYTDYCRLIAALVNFLNKIPNEPKRRTGQMAPWWQSNVWQESNSDEDLPAQDDLTMRMLIQLPRTNSISESAEQFKKAEQQAGSLNKLLDEITLNWRVRGLPVKVCMHSFSLFAPNRISESHVQILHVPLRPRTPSSEITEPRMVLRSSFIDPFAVLKSEARRVSVTRRKLNRGGGSHASSGSSSVLPHHQQHQLRDRTKPWPLWPNAIPSPKREFLNSNADRYGVDPYFRAWVRASINSRTKSTSYAKYMIELEDNPFINKRLEYAVPPSRTALYRALLVGGYKDWKEQYPSIANRDNYEHNRRLECRRTVENGTRLRILRFGFRHPIYPPHTPEMAELGLTEDMYQAIMTTIEDIRLNYKPGAPDCAPHLLASWQKLRKRSTEEALTRVSEYIRKLNASQRKLIWTIQNIPSVYDSGIGRDKKEWEISAWNGEDPLELLIQLEKWGIIEKRLSNDDDDDDDDT